MRRQAAGGTARRPETSSLSKVLFRPIRNPRDAWRWGHRRTSSTPCGAINERMLVGPIGYGTAARQDGERGAGEARGGRRTAGERGTGRGTSRGTSRGASRAYSKQRGGAGRRGRAQRRARRAAESSSGQQRAAAAGRRAAGRRSVGGRQTGVEGGAEAAGAGRRRQTADADADADADRPRPAEAAQGTPGQHKAARLPTGQPACWPAGLLA
jgi:hypothetical protein